MHITEETVALIVGATGGVGEPVARLLHQKGATVILSARDTKGTGLQALVESLGKRAHARPADVGVLEQAGALIEGVVREFGRLDVVVIASGTYKPMHLLDESIVDLIATSDMLHQANFIGPRNVSLSAGRAMQGMHGGVIVNISSHAAVKMLPQGAGYGASKAGIRSWMLHLKESFPKVSVVDVQPGTINTEIMHNVLSEKQQRDAIQPGDIAKQIVDLIESDNPPQEVLVKSAVIF